MQPKALHTRGGGYKNFNPCIHVAKFLFSTSPTRIFTLGPKKTLSYRADSTVASSIQVLRQPSVMHTSWTGAYALGTGKHTGLDGLEGRGEKDLSPSSGIIL